MAKRASKKRGTKRRAKRRSSSPTVTVRFANPRSKPVAKRRPKRKNPESRRTRSLAAKRGARRRRRSNPTRHYRRRRNPETFAQRAGKLAFGAVAALGTGVVVIYAASKIMPGQAISEYGIPALVFLAGVGIARTMPTLGVGMALGSFSPFVLPVASKVVSALTPATPAATTAAAQAAGIARAYRGMRALGRGGMHAVDWRGMSAVDMRGYR
jgi:hypothetical protein